MGGGGKSHKKQRAIVRTRSLAAVVLRCYSLGGWKGRVLVEAVSVAVRLAALHASRGLERVVNDRSEVSHLRLLVSQCAPPSLRASGRDRNLPGLWGIDNATNGVILHPLSKLLTSPGCAAHGNCASVFRSLAATCQEIHAAAIPPDAASKASKAPEPSGGNEPPMARSLPKVKMAAARTPTRAFRSSNVR
jgi:hypothetical protein